MSEVSGAIADLIAGSLSNVERRRRPMPDPYEPWSETICGTFGETHVTGVIWHLKGNPVVEIGHLHTPIRTRGKGHARKAMRALLKIADEMEVDTILKPEP